MHNILHQELYAFAGRVKSEAQAEQAAMILLEGLTRGMSMERKGTFYRDIVQRIGITELDADLGMATTAICVCGCGQGFQVNTRGRPKQFFSAACRKRVYRAKGAR